MHYLHSAVLDDAADGFVEVSPDRYSQIIDCQVIDSDGVSLSGNRIDISKSNDSLTLQYNVPENCELYVSLDDTVLMGMDRTNISVSRETGDYIVSNLATLTGANDSWQRPYNNQFR